MADEDAAARVMKARADTERLKGAVGRGELKFEAADGRMVEIRAHLTERGYDLEGDLRQQVADRTQKLEADVQALATDVAALEAAAG